jgi:hypothetical protein
MTENIKFSKIARCRKYCNCSYVYKLVFELVTGIDEIAVDIAKGTLTVIGVVDPVLVAKKLRKSGKMVEVVSVGPPKKEPDEEKVDYITVGFPSCCKECELVAFGFPPHYQAQICSIL